MPPSKLQRFLSIPTVSYSRNIRFFKQPPLHNSPGFFPHCYLKALRECSTVSFCKIIQFIIPSYQDHAISVLAALTSEMAPPWVGQHRCHLVTHSPRGIGSFLTGTPKDANGVSSFWQWAPPRNLCPKHFVLVSQFPKFCFQKCALAQLKKAPCPLIKGKERKLHILISFSVVLCNTTFHSAHTSWFSQRDL